MAFNQGSDLCTRKINLWSIYKADYREKKLESDQLESYYNPLNERNLTQDNAWVKSRSWLFINLERLRMYTPLKIPWGLWSMNLSKPSWTLFPALSYTSIICSKTMALGFPQAARGRGESGTERRPRDRGPRSQQLPLPFLVNKGVLHLTTLFILYRSRPFFSNLPFSTL